MHRRVSEHHAGGVPALGVGRDAEHKLSTAFTRGTEGPVAFVEVLIHVAALCRIGLEPAHGRGAGQSGGFFGEKAAKHDYCALSVQKLRNSTSVTIDKNSSREHSGGGVRPVFDFAPKFLA